MKICGYWFDVGLKEGKSACCGSGQYRGEYTCGGKRGEKHFELCVEPNENLFWDSYHLTESAYKQLAARMWDHTESSHTIGPYTIKNFFQDMWISLWFLIFHFQPHY